VLQMFMEWEMDHRNLLVIDWESAGNSVAGPNRLRDSVKVPYLFGRRPGDLPKQNAS